MTASRIGASRASSLDGVIAEMIEELAEKLRDDPATDVEAFLREHADFADRLRPLLPAVALMAELGRSGIVGSGSRPGAGWPAAPGRSDSATELDLSQQNGEPPVRPIPPHAGAEAAAGTLGDFRILREIARGGMGIVYEAEQIS